MQAILPGVGVTPESGLRYYQKEAVDSILKALKTHRSTLCVMATGLGKTQVFCELAKIWPGNVLVLAHREELVIQAKKRMEMMTGEWVEMEKADRQSYNARLVVGSVDSVKQKGRLERLGKDRFDLIIVDECHHYQARTYKRPLEYWGDAKLLGVTATPNRADKKKLGNIFESVAYNMNILQGVESGYLVPVKGKQIYLEEIDLSTVDKSGKDLNIKQLDDAMYKAVEGIVKETIKAEPNRQGIAFFPGVRSAQYAAERFNALKPGSAMSVDGKTDSDARTEIMDRFRRGDIQYLCNCMIATEGFDAPGVSMIILGRPTKSEGLYAQMVGRGTRVLPGVIDGIDGEKYQSLRKTMISQSAKKDCVILDFVGNSGKHSLVSTVDIFAEGYPKEVVKIAKKIEDENPDKDMAEILDEAQKTLEEMQRVARIAKSKVIAKTREFDPFKVFNIRSSPMTEKYGGKPMSDKQRDFLLDNGVDKSSLAGMDSGRAKKLISTIYVRRKHRLATFGQMKTLKKYGIEKTNISKGRASNAIDYLASTGWGKYAPVDKARLKRIVEGRGI
jgi:superfamily II DNA or RNA helicase